MLMYNGGILMGGLCKMKIFNLFFILGALSDACSAVLVQSAFVSPEMGTVLTIIGVILVLCGAAVAVYGSRKPAAGRREKEALRQSLALTIGMGAGLAFGQFFWKNPATGMLTGMLAGMIISNWIPPQK